MAFQRMEVAEPTTWTGSPNGEAVGAANQTPYNLFDTGKALRYGFGCR